MKEKLIMFGLGAAFSMILGCFSFVMALENEVIILQANFENRMGHLEKQQERCVQKDIYQVDKMLMNSRIERCSVK
jgi:hypothetical protein